MRTAVLVTAVLGASSALAQALSPAALAQVALGYLSAPCQQTLVGLFTSNTSIAQCLHVDILSTALASNGSLVPFIDPFLDGVCKSAPCTNTTLLEAGQAIASNCSSDLTKFGLSDADIALAVMYYPLAREIVCLTTTDPFNGTITNGTFANGTSPVKPTSASGSCTATSSSAKSSASSKPTIPTNGTTPTNGTSSNATYCATSLVEEFAAYLDADLTFAYIETVALGGNASAIRAIESIPPTALCSDCVFAALDLAAQSIPALPGIVVDSKSNTTLGKFINGTCAPWGWTWTTNGTLPSTIDESAQNSTYLHNVTNGKSTWKLSRRSTGNLQKRWPGEC